MPAMRLLDILIGTLVVFPLLAEALWLEIPGFESSGLTDLGAPLLAAVLIVEAVRRRREAGDALQRSPHRVLAATAAAAAVVVLVALAWRLAGWDFGTAFWHLTHGGGPIVLVAAVALAIGRWSSEPWEKSFFFRCGRRIAQAWLDAVERSPGRTLWIAAAAVGALFLTVSVVRHRAFATHGFDLGIFTNAIWNLTHGNGYVSSVKGGINLFSDHQSPLFWVLAPLFRTIPQPETLLFVQAFGLAAGGPALFYLGRSQLGREHWAPAALPWLYWCWLPLRNANAFDFHPEVFMLPLFLWAFVAFASARRGAKALGLLALIAALAAKESAPVVAAGIGLAWALGAGGGTAPRRWLGFVLMAAATAVFFFDVKVVPRFFGGEYAYMGHYQRFGGGIADLVLAPFTQPVYFFSQILDRERLNFLFWTLAPLGFLPLFCWRAAVAALPPYLMLFLSEGDQRVRIIFHYGIEPGTALFLALPLGLAVFGRRFGWKAAGLWMLFWSVACLGPGELARARFYYLSSSHVQWLNREAMPCLNEEAPMAATSVLIPHLAARPWISYPSDLRQSSGEPVRCVVIDRKLDNWPLGTERLERILAGLPERGYRQSYTCRSFSVYELGGSGCLRCVPDCR